MQLPPQQECRSLELPEGGKDHVQQTCTKTFSETNWHRRRSVGRPSISGAVRGARCSRKAGANEIVNIALVGRGVRAREITGNLPATCRIVAVCDVDLSKAESTKRELKRDWKVYQDYHDILDKEPVDGVVLCNCDHNRILPAIHACQASKDIYVEKPFSLYVTEGRALVSAVPPLQAHLPNRHAIANDRHESSGLANDPRGQTRQAAIDRLPQLPVVGAYTGGPEQPIPAGLAWDKWCGQTELFPYNEAPHRHWAYTSTIAAVQSRSWRTCLRHDPVCVGNRRDRPRRAMDDRTGRPERSGAHEVCRRI